MLLGSLAWSFVYASLPFHILGLAADAAAAVRWTGWILGIAPLTTVLTAPLWGRLTERVDPRRLYVAVELGQGLAFVGLALARTLPELFVARLVLGGLGAASTFAFVIAGRTDHPGGVRRQVAAIQSAMTLGQLVGPLAGAVAAARLGFRASFVVAGVVLLACAGLVWWRVPATPPRPRPAPRGPRAAPPVLATALVVLAASAHIFFLPAILPQVLTELAVAPARQLEVGGLLVSASGAAAALGALLAPRLGELAPERRLLPALLGGASVAVAALAAAPSVTLYGVLRFVEILVIAPLFPLAVARTALAAGGAAIGLVNAARLGAGFLAPVGASAALARWSTDAVHLGLALAGLACLPLAARCAPASGAAGHRGRGAPSPGCG